MFRATRTETEIQGKRAEMKHGFQESTEELEALLPAILDRAIKGE